MRACYGPGQQPAFELARGDALDRINPYSTTGSLHALSPGNGGHVHAKDRRIKTPVSGGFEHQCRLLAAAQFMDIDCQHLDLFRRQAPAPRRHHALVDARVDHTTYRGKFVAAAACGRDICP